MRRIIYTYHSRARHYTICMYHNVPFITAHGQPPLIEHRWWCWVLVEYFPNVGKYLTRSSMGNTSPPDAPTPRV